MTVMGHSDFELQRFDLYDRMLYTDLLSRWSLYWHWTFVMRALWVGGGFSGVELPTAD